MKVLNAAKYLFFNLLLNVQKICEYFLPAVIITLQFPSSILSASDSEE